MMQAMDIHRRSFRPSEQLDHPYVMLGVNVFAADTDQEARLLFTSVQQAFVQLRMGRPGQLPPPLRGYGEQLGPMERSMLDQALAVSVVGSPETVRQGLEEVIRETGADELMVTSQIFDHEARLRSFEITAAARDALSTARDVVPRAVYRPKQSGRNLVRREGNPFVLSGQRRSCHAS